MVESNVIQQLRLTARQREDLARALDRKAERYREEAKDMRQVAAAIARAKPDTASDSREPAK